MSQSTKKFSKLSTLFLILSILFNVAPLLYYIIDAMINSTLVVDKVKLCCTVMVVIILSAIAWINKTSMKSRVWVIMIGLWFCLDNFLAPLLIIGSTQILDEWIISPLHKHYKQKHAINKEIDRRI